MEENKTVKTMRAARDKIADSTRWTRGAHARDKDENHTDTIDSHAVSWSLTGAVLWAAREHRIPYKEEYPVLRRVARACAVLMPALQGQFDRLSEHAPDAGDLRVLVLLNSFNDLNFEQGKEAGHEKVLQALDMAIDRAKQFGVTAHRDERGAA